MIGLKMAKWTHRICFYEYITIGEMMKMTHDEIQNKIAFILEKLDKEKYPEIYEVMLRMGDSYFEGIGTEVDWNKAYHFYHNAEFMYYERLMNGDFMIGRCYEKTIRRQTQIRDQRNAELPVNGLE